MRVSRPLGKFVTDYDWDAAAGLPVVLHERTRELHCVRPPTPCQNVPVDLRAQTTYVYGLDLISATDKDGNQRYYFPDGLGSTALTIAGQSPDVQAPTYRYDAFGALRSGTASAEPFLFTGEQYDARARGSNLNNGLYYLRARYYDQSIGRFLSRDPLPGSVLDPQSMNPYPYVGNNPVNGVDPSGLENEGGNNSLACAAAAFALAAAVGFGFLALTAPFPTAIYPALASGGLLGLFAYNLERCVGFSSRSA